MPSNRWLDRTQPQTLMLATILMYVNAVLGLIDGLAFLQAPIGLILVLGPVPAGWGIANEKKWAYWLAVALACFMVVFLFLFFAFGALLNMVFYIALVALLLHPQSRNYRRTWFH